MWQAKPRWFFFGSLCLLFCLSVCQPAFSSAGADVPLSELTDQRLLERLATNLTTLGDLQEKQRAELQTAQEELLTAQEQSSRALTLSTRAQELSSEARDLANQSRDSASTASRSFESFKGEMQKEMDVLNRQNTWLKVGVGACLAIAAGALVWTAVSSAGGV